MFSLIGKISNIITSFNEKNSKKHKILHLRLETNHIYLSSQIKKKKKNDCHAKQYLRIL